MIWFDTPMLCRTASQGTPDFASGLLLSSTVCRRATTGRHRGLGIVIAGILLSCFNLNSVTNQEHFLAGNQLYQQAQFQAALTEYQAINPKNSVVWYNLGNCAYHLEQYFDASLFWKRAQLLELKSFGWITKLAKTSAQNLLQAQAKLITAGFKPTPKFTTEFNKLNSNNNFSHSKLNNLKISKFASLYNFMTLKIQQVLIQIPLVFLQVLLLLGLVLLWLVSARNIPRLPSATLGVSGLNTFVVSFLHGRKYRTLFLLIFLNLILVTSLYFKYNFIAQEWAIVNKPSIGLQIGPGENYPVVGHLGLAEFVKILGQNQQSWYAVQSEDGLQVGWTAADGLIKC